MNTNIVDIDLENPIMIGKVSPSNRKLTKEADLIYYKGRYYIVYKWNFRDDSATIIRSYNIDTNIVGPRIFFGKAEKTIDVIRSHGNEKSVNDLTLA